MKRASRFPYISAVSGLVFLAIGTSAIRNKDVLEQAANVATLALSIILQALPFILIGVIASSLIRFLVREEWIVRLAPDSGLGGVIAGSFLGLVFPVCDCGVMPVARSLLRKGVSMHTVLAYLLTAPVINPVVIVATALAFQWNWHLVALRVASTFFVGATTALLAGYWFNKRDFIGRMNTHTHEEENTKMTLHQLFSHAGDEFFDVGRYLIRTRPMLPIRRVPQTRRTRKIFQDLS